ncbi:MAG: NADP-dependent oxidoreductase [Anaerolineales bacterium]
MSEKMMQVIQFHDFGGPEVLMLEQAPVPQPGAGQVLLRVVAAGVNPADWKIRAGLTKAFMTIPLPYIPGLEAAGMVESVGPDVTSFKPGQAVFGLVAGGYAQYALANATDLQAKPANLTFEEAASVPVGALTAWGSLIETVKLQTGQRVLVQGAAGGVGIFGVQLADWKGAQQVIGTASAANAEFVRSLGANQAVDYQAAPFESVLHNLDVVFDTVGGDVFVRSLKVLHPGGVLVTVAAQIPPEMGKAEGVQVVRGGRAPGGDLAQIAGLLATGKIKTFVSASLPLSAARKSHEMSQTGHTRGKIVLKI